MSEVKCTACDGWTRMKKLDCEMCGGTGLHADEEIQRAHNQQRKEALEWFSQNRHLSYLSRENRVHLFEEVALSLAEGMPEFYDILKKGRSIAHAAGVEIAPAEHGMPDLD